MIKVKEMNCPNCGGSVKFSGNLRRIRCSYCDSVIDIADEYFNTQEAITLKEQQNRNMQLESEIHNEELKNRIVKALIVILILVCAYPILMILVALIIYPLLASR